MKTLTATLLNEQKKASGLPAVSLQVCTYGHPAKAAAVQSAMFAWTQFYAGAETPNFNGVAIAGDGSLVRARLDGTALKYQRIQNPGAGSDYATWSTMSIGGVTCNCVGPLSVCANASYVAIVTNIWDGSAYKMTYLRSADNGATWTQEYNGLARQHRGIGACYKADGTFGIASAALVTDPANPPPLIISRLVAGTWYYYTQAYDNPLGWMSMYHDGDWNIVTTFYAGTWANSGTDIRLYRIVCGDGYRAAAGVFVDRVIIGTSVAVPDDWQIIQQYADQPPVKVWTSPPPATTIATRQSGTSLASSVENLNTTLPFFCKPAAAPPIMSFWKTSLAYLFRLRPGTDFYDSEWYKNFKFGTIGNYGLALACDSNYIWATQAHQVWRSRLPGALWDIPTAGAGAGGTTQTIPQTDILKIAEVINPLAESTLEVTLDNSRGTYSSLPGTYIKKGSRLSLAYGYLTPSVDVPADNRYFIEDWSYDRSPGRATVTLRCIDAWGLLEQYTIPVNHEYNMVSNTYTVYALIEKLIQCIGGTLAYVSRSTDITTLYPKLEVAAGDSGAGLLRRLLGLVPDTIYFNGVAAYIINPLAADSPVYEYHFPGVN